MSEFRRENFPSSREAVVPSLRGIYDIVEEMKQRNADLDQARRDAYYEFMRDRENRQLALRYPPQAAAMMLSRSPGRSYDHLPSVKLQYDSYRRAVDSNPTYGLPTYGHLNTWERGYENTVRETCQFNQDNYERVKERAAKEGVPVVCIVGSRRTPDTQRLINEAKLAKNSGAGNAIYLFIDRDEVQKLADPKLAQWTAKIPSNTAYLCVFSVKRDGQGKSIPQPQVMDTYTPGAQTDVARSIASSIRALSPRGTASRTEHTTGPGEHIPGGGVRVIESPARISYQPAARLPDDTLSYTPSPYGYGWREAPYAAVSPYAHRPASFTYQPYVAPYPSYYAYRPPTVYHSPYGYGYRHPARPYSYRRHG